MKKVAFLLLGISIGWIAGVYFSLALGSKHEFHTAEINGKTRAILEGRAVFLAECVRWLAQNGRIDELKDVRACPTLLPESIAGELARQSYGTAERLDTDRIHSEIQAEVKAFRLATVAVITLPIVGLVLYNLPLNLPLRGRKKEGK